MTGGLWDVNFGFPEVVFVYVCGHTWVYAQHHSSWTWANI